MEALLRALTNAEWWLSVGVTSVALNILSSFIFKRADNWLSARSERRRSRLVAQKAALEAEAQQIASDSTALIILGQKHMSAHIEALTAIVFFSLLVGLANLLDGASAKHWITVLVNYVIVFALPTIALAMLVLMRKEESIGRLVRASRRLRETQGTKTNSPDGTESMTAP